MTTLKVLHTSDWHIGRRLYGHTRYNEFSAFFDWLYDCIVEQAIDVLIVAGDIFDTMTPSNKAQSLYYEFLGRVAHSSCQHVVIVAGNHDSPSLLDAPKDVLKFLDVHIVGQACSNIADEVIVLTDKHNQQLPQVVILAVPYLRDRDVRQSLSGESSSDKNSQLIAGIQAHYQTASDIATVEQANILDKHGITVPIIATGHLFAAGGRTTDDDGVRELYVGSLGQIGADTFADNIDYVALGHLHVPQLVGGKEHIRYSGSPIAMGFGEAKQQKLLLLVSFEQTGLMTKTDTANLGHTTPTQLSLLDSGSKSTNLPTISTINIPCFQKLAQIKGDIEHIRAEISRLKLESRSIWLEIVYKSNTIFSNLNEQLNEMVADSKLEIIKIKNTQTYQRVLKQSEQAESLQQLTRDEVFTRCLDTHEIADAQREGLTDCFKQIVFDIEHDDANAE